uniref:Uncharacterized protein n=1 Tax=Schistosoma curassoni TaxID=6186 RepID=A0A183L451_9TREM
MICPIHNKSTCIKPRLISVTFSRNKEQCKTICPFTTSSEFQVVF